MASNDDWKGLIACACHARDHALATYSKFKVGAALETETGQQIGGCNIENATYGLTICAERVALFKALSEGHRNFRRIVVVAETDEPTPPCGPCRQLLWEFAGDVEIVLAHPTTRNIMAHHQLSQLFPYPFDGRFLDAPEKSR